MKTKLNYLFLILVVIIIAIVGLWLFVNMESMTGMITGVKSSDTPEIVSALERIVEHNPKMLIEHDEHYAIILTNGDMIEFSKDISVSDADIVIIINTADIDDVINLKNIPSCPPPGQKMEDGRFCYISSEILAKSEPHLAEEYPKGILLKPFDIG